jgi:hypothetical protein
LSSTPQTSIQIQGALPQVVVIPRVRLWDDYGPVGEGASEAHYVRAENGSEYIAKGPALNPKLPYVAANELIAASLASLLTLPLLDYKLIEHGSDVYFGSAWIEKGRAFYPALTEDLFDKAANKSRCYDIAAFDYWIYNTDRHQHNLLLRKEPLGGSTAELLVLNDHSHAIIQANTTQAQMVGYTMAIPALHLDFLRAAVTSHSDFSAAISLIEGVTNAMISAVLTSVPAAFLAGNEVVQVEQFLRERRDNLRALVNNSLNVFPGLGGKAL